MERDWKSADRYSRIAQARDGSFDGGGSRRAAERRSVAQANGADGIFIAEPVDPMRRGGPTCQPPFPDAQIRFDLGGFSLFRARKPQR